MAAHPVRWQDPDLWRKVHNPWISEIYHAIKPQVAGRLALSIDQEVTLIAIDEPPARLRPDLHLSESGGGERPGPAARPVSGAVAYAEGMEQVMSESRHFLVLKDLGGERVVGLLEVLSPTNKGCYGEVHHLDFSARRANVLRTEVCYIEVDALPAGTRWLPRPLQTLASHSGVAWWSGLRESGRLFRGWAWNEGGPLPVIPWDLGEFGEVAVDLDATFGEACAAAGVAAEGSR